MGVDRELLYGSTPGGAHRIIIPRAQPPEALPPIPFAARSIFVENPSGVWYLVNGFTVPPWTWGLVNRLDVPTASVAVARLTTPEVLISEDYGGDLTIVAYEEALMPSLGRSLYPAPHDVQHAVVDVLATEAGASVIILAAIPDRRIVPLWSNVQSGVSGGLRDPVRVQVEVTLHDAVTGITLADHVISPEAPAGSGVAMAIPLAIGSPLEARGSSEEGGGPNRTEVVVEYFVAL